MLKTEGKPGISRSEFLRSAVGVSLAAGAGAAASAAEAALPWYKAQPPGARPVRWGFLVDVRKCIGCKACTVACKAEFDVRLGVSRASVRELEHGTYPNAKRSFLPWLCNHCENPICLTNCPVEEVEATFTFPNGKKVKYKKRATYQRPDGIVLIDQDRCIGCGNCVRDCPYKVRYLDPVKPAGANKDWWAADKCTLCEHRLEKGLVPACVNTCQGRARMVGNLNDPNSEISKTIAANKTEVLLPEKGTNPRCFYVGAELRAFTEGKDPRERTRETLNLKRVQG